VQTELPLRRLTVLQLRNTVTRLVEAAAPSSHAAVLNEIGPALTALPGDTAVRDEGAQHGGMHRLDQTVQQSHVDNLFQLGQALGTALTSSRSRMTEIFGTCATDTSTTNDSACVQTFVRTFATRAFRRPVTDDEVTFLASVANPMPIAPDGLANVVGLVVNAPDFFYLPESGATDATGAIVPLAPYELAARLAYHFWNEPPDDALLAAAQSGALRTDAGYSQQVARLAADPRADAALNEFFGDWFRLGETPDPRALVGRPAFDAFAGADSPTPALHQAMIDDVLGAARAAVHGGNDLSDLLTDSRSYARDPLLARIYGVAPWDGTSAPLVPPGARGGLLTRPAFLVSGLSTTRPIMKGVMVRMGLMCEALPPPPPNASTMVPQIDAHHTTRQAVEALTEQPGSVCAGCHANALNPLGFASEGFDALGRVRTSERIFDDTGNMIADLPIDSSVTPNVVPGDATQVSDAVGLIHLLDASGRVHSCLAREYFRFTYQRVEDTNADGCALAAVEGAALNGQSLVQVFQRSVLAQSYRQKRFE
jgi:hypothetical protein